MIGADEDEDEDLRIAEANPKRIKAMLGAEVRDRDTSMVHHF